MLRTYLKLALRNFSKFKIYTSINLVGLTIGLTVGVLILLYIMDELSFDKFHVNKDRIYKVVTSSPDGGMETNAWPVAYKLNMDYPEVEKVVYTRNMLSGMMIMHEGNRYEHNIFFASEDFFNIFSFHFVEGNPKNALKDPYSIVINQDIKNRYFGEALALGKTITVRDSIELTVSGVIEEVPSQSHMQFEAIISFNTYTDLSTWFSYSEGWGNFNVRNYILLKEGSSIAALKKKVHNMYFDNIGDWMKEMGVEFYVDFLPLEDIYLRAEYGNGFGPRSSIKKIQLVAIIGLFVIILACINFINITTARSIYRAKEVGLRKVIGSNRFSLFIQFMLESLLLTLISFAFVALIIDFILPFFNSLMNKDYTLSSLLQGEVLLGGFILILLISLLSGYYPAVVLSGYKPVEVLRGRIQSSKKGIHLRRSLVVFQFLVSALLVLGTLLVIKQLNFMRNQSLGFDKDQIMVVDTRNVPNNASIEAFKSSVAALSDVLDVSFTNALPGSPGWQGQWAYPEEFSEDNQVDTEYMAIDESFINTLGLELLAGRNFDIENQSDLETGLIINETTVEEMGWENPENALGKKIVSPSKHPEGFVIGVVRDYHGQGLQHEIWPKVMDYSSMQYGRYYAIKFSTGNTSLLISEVEGTWKDIFNDYAFEYSFLDQDFEREYQAENQLMKVFVLFAFLGVIIACIGLLGLISFMILTRYKEIGIRKVLGASVITITRNLTREFIILVIIADLIAIPIAWIFGNQWISTFAYHTDITPMIFIFNILITLMIAALTISFQTIKAAKMNPVNTLKNE